MKNKEKYKKDLSERDICDKASPWRDAICRGKICAGCAGRFIEWCEQEATPGLTGLEEEILKSIDPVFEFIARDKYGKMFVYRQKPRKMENTWASKSIYTQLPLPSLFDWIRFEDDEPWRIDDLVKRPALDSNTRPRDLVRPRDGTEAECL